MRAASEGGETGRVKEKFSKSFSGNDSVMIYFGHELYICHVFVMALAVDKEKYIRKGEYIVFF